MMMSSFRRAAQTAGKIWTLLTRAERRRALVVLGLMLIGMVLETLGIGLVIPAVALLTKSDIGGTYPQLRPLLAKLGNPTQEHLIVGGMLTLFGVFVFKALFMALLTWRETSFAFGVQAQLSQRLFTSYLRQPYTFHLQRNSAHLIQNVTNEVSAFTFSVMLPTMGLMTEALVLLGFGALLFAVEPIGALIVVCVIGSASLGFYHFTHRRIARWGEARQLHEGLRMLHLQQGLGGVKDVKLLGREAEFLEQYRIHNTHSARVAHLQHVLQQMPKVWLEVLAVGGLALLVVSMLASGRTPESLVPTLGLFGAAAFRLIPSVNRQLNAVQSLRFGVPIVDTLHAELALAVEAAQAPTGSTRPLKERLELHSVTYAYPGASGPALRRISLNVRHGECVGFIGTSGSGKSTLVDVLLGLLTPDSGEVRVDGVSIQDHLRGWQDQIGYVPQSIFLTDDTLARNVAFGLSDADLDESAIWRALRAARLDEFVRDLPHGLNTVVGERGVRLSGGQRQRVGIARALYHNPGVLVLDEATSSLDNDTERGVMEAVGALRLSKTIIIVAHRLSTVDWCNRLYRLENGEIREHSGTPDTIAAVARESCS
jgi:ATP-binding cassette, subfamily B, bacterial PglK